MKIIKNKCDVVKKKECVYLHDKVVRKLVVSSRKIEGTVVWIHPLHRYHRVRFDFACQSFIERYWGTHKEVDE